MRKGRQNAAEFDAFALNWCSVKRFFVAIEVI